MANPGTGNISQDFTASASRTDRIARSGFTIPEMLAVIAVIVIILSILLPSLSKAKLAAQAAICRSNLHQQAIALRVYVNESRGYLPGAHTGPGAAEQVMIWMPRIRRYVDNAVEIFNCPNAKTDYLWKKVYGSGLPARYGYEANEQRVANGSGRFNYGINDWGINETWVLPAGKHLGLGNHIDRSDNPGWEWGEIKAVRVKAPSNMVAIGDSIEDGVWDAVMDPSDRTSYQNEYPGNRHFGGLNIAFVDCHVEWMLQSDALIRPGSTGDQDRARRWNNDNEPHINEYVPYVP